MERGNTHTLLITTRSTLVTAYINVTLVTAYINVTLVTAYINVTLVTAYISHSSAYHSVEQLMEGVLEHGSLYCLVQHNVVHRRSIVHGELKIKIMLTHNISFKPQLIIRML